MNKNSLKAHKSSEKFSKTHREKIFDAIKLLKKATAHDISKETGLSYHAINRRLSEMRKDGEIKYFSDREVNGYNCAVYRIKNTSEPVDVIEKVSKSQAEKECVKLFERVQKLEKENKELKRIIGNPQLKLFS